MKTLLLRPILASAVLATAMPALPQEASQNVQSTCRQVSSYYARAIMQAKRANKDPQTAVRRVAESWAESVFNHMLFAASASDSLTEAELSSIGYSYCVERRPVR